jgi:hypothetical protein
MGTTSTERLLAGAAQPAPSPFRRPSGRASYPRRVTLDLDDERYEWLKEQAWQSRIPGGIAGLLRAVIDVLTDDDDLVAVVAETASAEGR